MSKTIIEATVEVVKRFEARNCPFCGSDRLVLDGALEEDEQTWWITCIVCKANGPEDLYREDAVEKWNREGMYE